MMIQTKLQLNTPPMKRLARNKLYFLDLLFPNRCAFCGQVIRYDILCCDNCLSRLELIDNYCHRCGKTICQCQTLYHFDKCEVSTVYDDFVQRGILAFKSNNGFNISKLLCGNLADKIRENIDISSISFITCVPASKAHVRKSGYNQSEIIAKELSKLLGLPTDFKIIRRTNVRRPQQHTLSTAKRKRNVVGMYAISDRVDVRCNGKNILLCDDVLTTGSTLNECSMLLKKHGAAQVFCAVLAVTPKEK